MDATKKSLWVKALRTGVIEGGNEEPLHITQGKYDLRPIENKMCCLGVLCEIYRRETGNGQWSRGEGKNLFFGESGVLPGTVAEWAGLESCNPTTRFDTYSNTMSELNDKHELNFQRIADIIDRDL